MPAESTLSAYERTPMRPDVTSMDCWYSYVILGRRGSSLFDNMYTALEGERPRILSIVGERSCNLQCSHCIFQKERRGSYQSSPPEVEAAARTIVRQMGAHPSIVHEGRIFLPEQLEWLSGVRAERPDSAVGMIDNGSFLNYAESLRSSGFKFDWLDISIDGPEEVHNQQRNSAGSFQVAMRGIAGALEFLNPGGRVASLFTLTSINSSSVFATCRLLPKEVNEWHITTLSPARPEIATLSVNREQLCEAWCQITESTKLRPVFFRIYFADDLRKLAEVVGKEKFLRSVEQAKVDLAAMQLTVDGVTVIYYPQSVCTNETFVLDADCFYRVPYSVAYALQELRSGVSRFGEDLSKYTVGKVDAMSSFRSLYAMSVRNWKNNFGPQALEKEVSVFEQIRR